MSKIKLTPYQATVFRDLETLLETRGSPLGIKIKPKAYWLSKKVAVYIMHNISLVNSTSTNKFDVENVYDWLFGPGLPTQTTTSTKVSGTGNATPPPPPPPNSWKDIKTSMAMELNDAQQMVAGINSGNVNAGGKLTMISFTHPVPPGFPY